jgi:hypothetical protein
MSFTKKLESIIGPVKGRIGDLISEPTISENALRIEGERGYFYHGGAGSDTYAGVNGARDIYHYHSLADAPLSPSKGENLLNYRPKDERGRDEDKIVFDERFAIVEERQGHLTLASLRAVQFEAPGKAQALLLQDTETYRPHTYIIGDANGDGKVDSLIDVQAHITGADISFGTFNDEPPLIAGDVLPAKHEEMLLLGTGGIPLPDSDS